MSSKIIHPRFVENSNVTLQKKGLTYGYYIASNAQRKTDLLIVSKKDVKLVEIKLNNIPVLKFNYSTPNLVLQQKIALIACTYNFTL